VYGTPDTVNPHYARTTRCDRGYGRPSGRPRVFLRQAQDKLTLRRTDKYASGPSSAVPRDGRPVGTTISTISLRRLVHYALRLTPFTFSHSFKLRAGPHSVLSSDFLSPDHCLFWRTNSSSIKPTNPSVASAGSS